MNQNPARSTPIKQNQAKIEVPPGVSLDQINAVILIADSKGEIIYANAAVKQIYLLEPSTVLKDGWWQITSNSKEEAVNRQNNMIKLAAGELDLAPFNLLERPFKRRDGKTIWTQWTNTLLSDNRVIGIAQDITEKKILERELERKNHENEMLLQEVYHRVKNNLQIILSLLKFEFEGLEDELVLNALRKTKSRIYSMSLIHNEICNINRLDDIDFTRFIEKLLVKVMSLYAQDKEIELNTSINCERITTENSVNIGLILVELVANAIQHAFRDNASGNLNISINPVENEQCEIRIEDDGIGMDNINPYEANSLGFEIVTAISDQLEGKFEIHSNEKGTTALVIF